MTKYYNNGSRKELNCEEHIDPGLLSLHLKSTQPGLQLKDEYGNWIDCLNNKDIAIIWTGDMACKINPEIHPGIHRVINIDNMPRIGMWYEICIKEQEHKELIDNKKPKEFERKTGIPFSKSR